MDIRKNEHWEQVKGYKGYEFTKRKRKTGKLVGHVDKYYRRVIDGKRFRSLKAVKQDFLNIRDLKIKDMIERLPSLYEKRVVALPNVVEDEVRVGMSVCETIEKKKSIVCYEFKCEVEEDDSVESVYVCAEPVLNKKIFKKNEDVRKTIRLKHRTKKINMGGGNINKLGKVKNKKQKQLDEIKVQEKKDKYENRIELAKAISAAHKWPKFIPKGQGSIMYEGKCTKYRSYQDVYEWASKLGITSHIWNKEKPYKWPGVEGVPAGPDSLSNAFSYIMTGDWVSWNAFLN